MQNKPYSSATISNGKSGKHLSDIKVPSFTGPFSALHPEMERSLLQGGDYAVILKTYGLQYALTPPYLQVGEIKQQQGRIEQGWILHLSVVKYQFHDLLQKVLPELIAAQVPFKIIRDSTSLVRLLEGGLGFDQLGKVITIYQSDTTRLKILVQKLILLTQEFTGPAIPTDIHLGGAVYTCYGVFTSGLSTEPIPFVLPKGVDWPFADICPPKPAATPSFLKRKYYGYQVLKSDAKGKVVKGIQIGKYGRFSSCLIKEGKKAVYMDDYRRDIRDRLRWQYDLHKDLQGKVPLPEAYDLFESSGDVYLVMELINGKVLHEKIVSLFNKDSWFHLPVEKKTRILDYLLSIIEIIDRLHRQQYVHRDVTPVNFMVDPTNKLYIIDMELTYSPKSKRPEPPFRLGTIGFMSPEQVTAVRPTVKEDIYGLGATMISLFTGMSPSKFDLPVQERLSKKGTVLTPGSGFAGESLPCQQDLSARLFYFLQNRPMAELISQCLNYDPALRPELDTIRSQVIQYKNEVIEYNKEGKNKEGKNENDDKQINREQSSETIFIPYNKVPITPVLLTGKIQSVLEALSGPELLGPDHLWFSFPGQKERLVINENLQSAYYPGLERGLSGVLLVLATAKKLGFPIDPCLPAYRNSWLYLQQHFLQQLPQMPPGLMTGAAGVAIALTEGLEARLLTADPQSLFLIQQVLALPGTGIEVASGISGQGITLMKCSACLDPEFLQHQLEKYQEILTSSQLKDGSWILPIDNNSKRGKKITGYAHGIAGIAYFLLRSYTFNHRETVLQAGIKALHWLEVNSRSGKVPTSGKNTGFREETAYWTLEPKSKETDPWGFNGTLSIAMVFIYAYDLLKDPSYRQIAEKAMLLFPENLVDGNFSQASGLSGVGEVYLDAYRVFKEDKWYTRANWIAGVLLNVSKTSSNGGIYWQEDNYRTSSSADLLVGNSGILHFLMRLNQPEKLSHSLLLFNE